MAETKTCMDCHRTRPAEAFYKTRAGAGRSDRCRDCIEKRAEAHRADRRIEHEELEAELEEFLSSGINRPVPGHLQPLYNRLLRGPLPMRQTPKLSNRPHMARCPGCGDAVPKRNLWEYRPGQRSKYCKPCFKRRAAERECVDCDKTTLTDEFFEGLKGVSPYCRACREKRTHEKHCPRCGVTKAAGEFNQSRGKLAGWCKPCSIEAQRARRAAARVVKTPH